MYYVITLFVGIITGGIALWLYLMDRHAKLLGQVKSADSRTKHANEVIEATRVKEQELNLLERQITEAAKARAKELDQRDAAQRARESEFERHVISYNEMHGENIILKRDLQNIDVNLNKLQMDGELREQRQKEIDERATQLAKRYLSETIKSVVSTLGPSNFSACKQRLVDVILRCREIGFNVSVEEESKLLADLRAEFEKAVRAAFAREEQARIKAQIREEEKLKREIDRELKQLERERAAIQAALDQALAAAQGQHSAEVERLQARLAEAEEKSKRALSMAQQTKAGHVYVISNIGTFGLDVFKIGMTRRLDPKERVTELGSASVPFPFDVHMMISCTNAPQLENALHRALHKKRINKANPRKEFFKVDLTEIIKIVTEHHGVVEYKADPEALEYHQSLTMSEEDSLFIDQVYETVEDESAYGAEEM
jgi:hypothetical protein